MIYYKEIINPTIEVETNIFVTNLKKKTNIIKIDLKHLNKEFVNVRS